MTLKENIVISFKLMSGKDALAIVRKDETTGETYLEYYFHTNTCGDIPNEFKYTLIGNLLIHEVEL